MDCFALEPIGEPTVHGMRCEDGLNETSPTHSPISTPRSSAFCPLSAAQPGPVFLSWVSCALCRGADCMHTPTFSSHPEHLNRSPDFLPDPPLPFLASIRVNKQLDNLMSVHKVSPWALPSPFTIPRDAPYPLPPAIQARSSQARVATGVKGKLAKSVETNAAVLARERIARQREELSSRQGWGGQEVWIGGREPQVVARSWSKGQNVGEDRGRSRVPSRGGGGMVSFLLFPSAQRGWVPR